RLGMSRGRLLKERPHPFLVKVLKGKEVEDRVPQVAQNVLLLLGQCDGFPPPFGKKALIYAKEFGEKAISQPKMLFQPIDPRAESFSALVLKKVGDGNHDTPSTEVFSTRLKIVMEEQDILVEYTRFSGKPPVKAHGQSGVVVTKPLHS